VRLYTDIDPFCCEVLRARVADGGLLPGEVWERDIKTLTAEELKPFTQVHLFCGIGAMPLGLEWGGFPPDISIITGGFPCQDISNAGNMEGIEGERSGLWSEMCRLVCELRPRFALVENVSALLARGIGRVLGDLADCGYDAEWDCYTASELGFPHIRERIFILAYPAGIGWDIPDDPAPVVSSRDCISHLKQPGYRWERQAGGHSLERVGWSIVPDIRGSDDGIPFGMERCRAIGNAIVPQCVEVIARAIMQTATREVGIKESKQ